jgi:FkbM family methyltransferase
MPWWASAVYYLSQVWRLQTLRIVRTLFGDLDSPLVLNRPFEDYRLFVDVSRTTAQGLLYLKGSRFVDEKMLVDELVKPGMTAVDVGANIGYYMLLLSTRVGNNGTVICLEPDPENLTELSRNLRCNQVENAEVVESAVGETDGEVRFQSGKNGNVSESGDISVPLVKLDSVLEGRECDFIKVDVEGYEGSVLRGAKETIQNKTPKLLVEIHPWVSGQYGYEYIFDFLGEHYDEVSYYEKEELGALGRAYGRYASGGNLTQIKDEDGLLRACLDGTRTSTFWAVCGI